MKKLYLLLIFLFFVLSNLTAQTTEETFEGLPNGASFTSNSKVFNLSSDAISFTVVNFAGLGYSASNKFIQVQDTYAQTGTITAASGNFKLNSLWIYLTGDAAQNPGVTSNGAAGSVNFRGTLGGVQQFSVTRSTSGGNTGYAGAGNGFIFIDFATEGGSNNTNINIDKLEIKLSANYDYFAIDNFKWTSNTTPSILTSGTINAFTACSGFNSSSQSFNASGSNLSANITVTAPTGFEVSLASGSGYGSTVTLTQSGGTVASTPVYVRTTTGASGSPSGNVALTSTGATTVNVAVSGTVTAIPNVTAHPTGKTVCAGSNTTFSVTASNSPNYQWQVNTGSGFSDITNGGVYTGATTSVLTITGATSGMNTYQYRARVINGSCTDNSNSATLTVPTALGSSVSSQTNVSTYGGNNGSATVAGSGGTTPYFYSWSPSGGTAATATGLSAGTYTVTITDSTPNGLGGCSKTQTVTITQPAGVSTSVSSLSAFTTCSGTASTAQSFTVSGDSGLTANVVVTAPTGYEVSLSSGSGYASSVSITQSGGNIATTTIYARLTSSATGTPAGNITVASTGVTTKNVAVTGTVNSGPFISGHPAASSICPGTDTTFSVTAVNVTGYQWQENTGSGFINITNGGVYSGATTATLSLTAATAGMNGYAYRVVVTGGCTPAATSNSATLTMSGSPAVTANPPNRTICTGNNTTFSVTATGATGYQWQVSTDSGNSYNDIANGAPYSGVTTSTLTVTGATSAITGYRYRCTVNSGCGSTNSNAGTLTVITIAVGQSQTNVTTYGGSNGTATATPSGGITPYIYSWFPSGGTAATATGLTAGTYTVTVTDNISCSAISANYVITQPAGVAASVSTLTAFATCSGTASTAKNFTVNGGGLTADLVVTAPTGYEVSLTSGSGYSGSVSLTQTGGNVATTTIYVRMAASASGTMAGNVTVSSTGVTSKDVAITGLASNLSASSYTVTNVSCFGGTNGSIDLTPAGGQIPYTYNWGSASTQDRTSIPAGTYSVTITDGNGCTYTISNIVVGEPATALNAATGGGKTNVSCNGGNNGSATVAPTGGTPGYTYSWSPSGGTAATASGLAVGIYTVTVTDANGCQATRSFTITQPPALNVATGGGKTDVSCNAGANGTATVAPTGGTPGYTYSWNTTPVQTTATATGLTAGTYTVTVTDANNCQATRSYTITQPTALTAATGGSKTDVSCNGGNNGSATVTPTGGTPGYTYSWAPSGGTAATASGLAAGTYTVTVTDANNCQATRSFTINQPATTLSAATGGSQNDVSCNGGNNGSATVAPTGGTPGYTYSWAPSGGTAATASGLAAGTYTVTVTDANGCQATRSFTITQPATPVNAIPVAQTNIACRGAATGSATVSVSGGTAGYTYSWAPTGGNAPTASNLAAGTYTVTVTDANGCIDTQSFTLTQPAAVLSATAGTISNVSCNGGANGSAQVVASGGTPGYTYSWAPSGGTAATASGLTAGTYTVTVTDANGCTATRNFTITQPTSLVAAFGAQTNVSCNGGTNGSATVNVTGGTPSYTYSWAPTGGTAATASGLVAGTYTVTVTDANNCQATQSFTINQPTALISTISKSDVLCNGGSTGSATVAPTGGTPGYTYLWSPAGGTAATASGLTVGNYSCLITDANGCTITKNITINQPSALGATTSQTNATCSAGGDASVTAFGGVGGYTYLWSPGGQTTSSVTGLSAGNYSCLITDANGCTVTKNFVITTNNTLVASTFQTNLLCNGSNTGSAGVIPSGAPGPFTYVWSPSGGNADTATNLAAGTYSVLITSSNGCSITKNFTITQPTALVATAGAQTNTTCNGGTNGSATVNVTGGTGAYTYQWAPTGGTAATASGLAAGTYTVTVKDANLCQTTQSFTITQPTALVATAGAQTNVSCNSGTNGSATVSVTGGTGAYTYQWAPTGGTAATASGLAAGTYTVTVKDANLCQTTQSFTITQPTALVATAGAQTNVLCNGGTTGSATVSVTGGTGAYTYLWAPSGGTAATASGLVAGTYTVTVKDANLCQTTQSFTITQPTALVATAGAQTNVLCNGGTTGSATVNVTGGTGAYTYLWAPSGGTAATASGLAAGTYTVTVKDANLCQTTQSFTIIQPTALVATAGAQTNTTCNGGTNGSATVNVTGGTGAYTYLWAPTGGTGATASGLAAGTYTVTVKDANLCQTTQSFTITQPTALVATAGAQTNVSCNGGTNGSATVNVTGGTGAYTYLWAPTGGTGATASGLAAGTYTVTVKDANLCQTTQSFTITQPAVLVATAGTQTNVLCNGGTTGSATVNVTGGTGAYTYLWAPTGGTAATASGLAAGTYTVTVKDANLCQTTQSFTITQPTVLVATAGAQTNLICNGASNGTATVNVTGGTGAYTYQWAPSGGTGATASGLAAGTYTVTVKDANLCQTTQSFTITQPVAMTATTSQTNILCFGSSTGSATVSNITGGTGTYTYIWAPTGGTAATATGLAAGTYTCTITDGSGCTLVKTITITQPPVLVVNGSSSNVSCNGAANGTASVSVSGGTPGYTYSWAPSGGTEFSATGLSGGTYVCTVTDANGCTKTRSFTILEQTPIVVTSVKTNVLCHGAATGSATISATGGVPNYMYAWSTGSGSPTITGLVAGTYTCTVSDALGCSVVHTVTITSPDALDVTTTQTNVSCSGNNDGSLDVLVTGGVAPYTYAWTPAVGTGSTITGLAAGNYSLTVTDANGCTTLRNYSLTQPEPLTATLTTTNVNCYGGNDGTAIAVVTGGTAPYTYEWTAPGGGTPDPENLVAGTYTVTITDDHGCTFTGNITITQPLQLVVTNNPQNATVTTGSNAMFTSTIINATGYQWQYSTDGTTWNNVVNGGSNPTYSGATTNILSVIGIPASYDGYLYRIQAINAGSCTVNSNSALLNVNNALLAVNDDFSETEILVETGGIAGDVTANDLFNSLPVDDADVIIAVVDNDGLTGVTIDADGNLTVPAGAAAGSYTVTYSICDAADLTNCSTAEADVVVSEVSGTEDFRDIKLSIYPNPASTQVFIKIPDFSSHKNMKVALFDLNGRLVKENYVTAELQSIDVSGVESGVYIFKVTSDTGETSRRIIVEKKF